MATVGVDTLMLGFAPIAPFNGETSKQSYKPVEYMLLNARLCPIEKILC